MTAEGIAKIKKGFKEYGDDYEGNDVDTYRLIVSCSHG